MNEVEFSGTIHPFAEIFPLMSDDELLALAEHIAEVGLLEAITLNQEGDLVDGRNRKLGCDLAGVAPRYETVYFADDDAVARFVQGRNAERRDLSPGQSAMARAMLLAAQGRRKNGRWERGSLVMHQLVHNSPGRNLVAKAGLVLDWRADLADEIMQGRMALDAAYLAAQEKQAESTEAERAERELAAQKKMLRDRRPDLADLVEKGNLKLAEALLLYQREKEKEERDRRLYLEARERQNLHLHQGFTAMSQLGNPQARAEMETHYSALSTDITGQKLKELAEILFEVSGTWRSV